MSAGRFSLEAHGRSGHGFDVRLDGSWWSAAAFKASLKRGDTLRLNVSLSTSSNVIAPRKRVCICAMLAVSYDAFQSVSMYPNGHCRREVDQLQWVGETNSHLAQAVGLRSGLAGFG